MTKRKIGVVIYGNPDYYPPTINAVHELSKSFDVVLIGRNCELAYWQYPNNVTVYRLGYYSSVREREKISALKKTTEYINFINESKEILQDVALIYAYDPWAFVTANIISMSCLHSKPIVYQLHEFYENFPLTSLFGWIQRLEKRWINNALIVIQPELERAILYKKNMSIQEEIIIVPNFPRIDFYQNDRVNDSWFEELICQRFKKKEVILQGAISPDSSILELIDSLQKLPNDFRLKLIGYITDNNHEKIIELANQLNVSSQLEYYQPVGYDRLPVHTWNASLGTCLKKKNNSNLHLSVTSSNKIYEYAACGLPVIVSDFSNYKNYLSEEPWVYFANPNDSKAIASTIRDIFADFGVYRSICLSARQACETRFNYEKVFKPVISEILNMVF